MKIWYSKYQLYPQFLGPNKSKNKFRKGAILRIQFENQSVGFADLCPHADFGDRPIEMELQQLSIGKPSPIGEQSIYFAKLDAQARFENSSLYDRTTKIKNHFLITELLQFDLERIEKLQIMGFSEFKIKLGRELVLETMALEKLSNRLKMGSRLRLDFNLALNRDRFVEWFEKNQKWLRPFLEFIEDPFLYSAKDWREVGQKWNIPLALDLAADPIVTQGEGAAYIVIKPAVQNVSNIVNQLKDKNKKFVFTHYMDFPLGQMFALAEAQKYFHDLGPKLVTCGLQLQDLYEGLTFQDVIKSDGPFVLPPEGMGVGFDKLLNEQKWVELT